MKILVVSQKYYPEPFRVTDICETLVKMGHNITVLCGLPNYGKGEIYKGYAHKKGTIEEINGVKVIRCNEHPRGKNSLNLFMNFYSFYISANRYIKRLDKDFDIVLINQLSPVLMSIPGIKYAKKYNKKVILYCYDLWPASLAAGGIKKESIIYKYYNIISRNIYKKVDKILITSQSFEKYFYNVHHILKDKIEYLPQYCEDTYSSVKTILEKTEYNFVFAGNIGKMQSVQTIIKAANEIKTEENIKIHIIGDGSDLENCKKLCEKYEMNNVIFYGRKPLEEMPYYYSKADAMIVTLANDELISYTLPGKIQSYMCSKKPIIASANGETANIINESKCGLCCDAENYIRLAELLKNFKKENYEYYSNNSTNYYNNNFRKDMFFKKLIKSLENQNDNI